MEKEKAFIKSFENKVKNTIEKYNLVDKDDRVIVACSGGKDSTTTLYLMKKFGYDVEALTIDLSIGDYSKKNLENIKSFCRMCNIKLNLVDVKKELGYSMCYIKSLIQSKTRLNACAICGVLKKWLLNKKARELGANKLATGHNLDDEASTVVMNLFKANKKLILSLGPKTGVIDDKKFIQRIKPLYFCLERDVEKYSRMMGFPVLYEPCPCSIGAFRKNIKKALNKLEQTNSKIKENLVKMFLELKSDLKNFYNVKGPINHCKICDEPCRNNICKKCKLFEIINYKKDAIST